MPLMNSGGSEDFYSTDEVKVYKDEGNKDEEKRSSENLSEDKLGLVTESEEGKNSLDGNFAGSEKTSNTVSDDEKSSAGPAAPGQGPPGSLGFFLPPYASAYSNGTAVAGKFSMLQPPYPFMYNEFAEPPPAHKGYSPVYTDPKTGLPRPPIYATYPAPPGQFPHPLYSPEFTSASWHRPGYPLTSGAFPGPFPPSLSSLSRYGPPGLIPHPGLAHPVIPHPASLAVGPKSELMSPQLIQETHSTTSGHQIQPQQKKKNHIKKPLNAFMLFMKEQRPKVIAECTLRESSAINQILGRRWHALDRSEQAKYYEMARKEKELHLQLYPGWSARDNYAVHQKKKKRKKEGQGGGGGSSQSGVGSGGAAMSPVGGVGGGGPLGSPCVDSENKPGECPNERKCRARYGMEQQSRWCKPCRRKKKCTRYKDGSGEDAGVEAEESLTQQNLDSSTLSGLDSDSTVVMEEPSSVKCEGRSQHSSRVLSDTPGSSLSLVRDESQGKKVADIKPFQSLALSLMATGTPALLTSPLTFPSHAADTFLFPPPSFCLPYHVPPSPLARQIMYQLPSHSLESSPALQADGAKQITFLI